jgi:drug/metabolite transporter (DMT)-like permease
VSPIIYTGIFYALGFGYFIFGETYEWPVLLGMGLVILGLLLNLRFGVR